MSSATPATPAAIPCAVLTDGDAERMKCRNALARVMNAPSWQEFPPTVRAQLLVRVWQQLADDLDFEDSSRELPDARALLAKRREALAPLPRVVAEDVRALSQRREDEKRVNVALDTAVDESDVVRREPRRPSEKNPRRVRVRALLDEPRGEVAASAAARAADGAIDVEREFVLVGERDAGDIVDEETTLAFEREIVDRYARKVKVPPHGPASDQTQIRGAKK